MLQEDPQIEMHSVGDDIVLAFEMLRDKRIDAVVTDSWAGNYIIIQKDMRDIVPTGDPIATYVRSFAVKKGNTTLLGAVNAGLASLQADGTIARIYAKWQPKEVVVETREQVSRKTFIATVVFMASVLIMAAIWVVTMKREIARRRKIEAVSRESEARFRTLFDHAPEAIVTFDADTGQFVDINDEAVKLFGRSREELLRGGPERFYASSQPDSHLAKGSMDIHAQRALLGETVFFDRVVQNGNGESAYCKVSLVRLPWEGRNLLRGSFVEISKLKKTEQDLRKSEDRFSRILSILPYSAIITRLSDGVIVYTNKTTTLIYGYDREELLGHSAIELNIWAEPSKRADFVQRVKDEDIVVDFEFLLRRKDGVLREVVASAQRIEFDEEDCVLSVTHDVTEMKIAQRNMVQTEKMVSLGGLAAGMAHEINNPLGIIQQAVMGCFRRLDPNLPASSVAAQELGLDLHTVRTFLERRNIITYLEAIREAGSRGADIVRNMLNFSRKSDGAKVVSDLAALARHALSLAENDYDLKKLYDFRRINVTVQAEPNLPLVKCIPGEIEQVLLNLLRNAAQAMTQNVNPSPSIALRLFRHGTNVIIEVEDNGPGIQKEHLDRLFDPFFTTKRAGEGTGLGLSVSYFIIASSHGGNIAADSEPGKGARFTITLPTEGINEAR
jgi:PAS domain S-box-containing protein